MDLYFQQKHILAIIINTQKAGYKQLEQKLHYQNSKKMN